MTVPPSTKSLRILTELDRSEAPAWLHESEQLQADVIDRLRELKENGVLYSGLQLHSWVQELTKAAFQTLELGIVTDPSPIRKLLTVSDLYRGLEADHVVKKRKDLENV